ncbi:hypothetical protein BXZ70DRAFT_991890 [Cristinia sonorae]|uniref:Proline-rich protein n=1 Tax=Cristinia sonorae TaxID=1940300 RepID=A0A8K0XNQ6_9AGAR|nr:hypothetical protein BXZ70DRAFT_991890 [Cristinia sonorae]
MKFSATAVLLAVATFVGSTVQAAPMAHEKRIAQVIAEGTAQWEKACLAAGGGQRCNPLSVSSMTTLLIAAGPCEQQNKADEMIDLAKQLGGNKEMIRLAQIFAQQPRNTPNSVSVPYCQAPPRNPELNGLFQCQFAGANKQTFVNGVKAGGPGTIPFGRKSPVSPAGSCPAHPQGPIPDGQQLVNLARNPRAGGRREVSPANNAAAGFRLQNGKDAIALNNKFRGLNVNSRCKSGENACINGAFAQCVFGKFVTTRCSAGTTCAALPLVNSPGTSVTCTTPADVDARIRATGAKRDVVPVNNAASANVQFENGKAAKALNAKFANLNENSPCQSGENACINGAFAQCVFGKFVVMGCGAGTTCAALPLVNSAGTSITCTTPADAQARISRTGA